MRRSKLESYEQILKALAKKPLTIDRLAYETNIDCAILKQRLDFMIGNGLTNERQVGKKALVTVSERGIAVLRALSIQKRLDKVRSTIMNLDETTEVLPTLSRRNRRTN
jgi:predicted transcriptional regulator